MRTHLDYACSVWAPYKKKYINKIESVQKRATKQIPGFNNLSYPERLKKLKLPTMAYRRIKGDMIETYKIINEKYDPEASSFLKLLSSSGNGFSRRNNSNKNSPTTIRPHKQVTLYYGGGVWVLCFHGHKHISKPLSLEFLPLFLAALILS